MSSTLKTDKPTQCIFCLIHISAVTKAGRQRWTINSPRGLQRSAKVRRETMTTLLISRTMSLVEPPSNLMTWSTPKTTITASRALDSVKPRNVLMYNVTTAKCTRESSLKYRHQNIDLFARLAMETTLATNFASSVSRSMMILSVHKTSWTGSGVTAVTVGYKYTDSESCKLRDEESYQGRQYH
jgi:hypothetical protein